MFTLDDGKCDDTNDDDVAEDEDEEDDDEEDDEEEEEEEDEDDEDVNVGIAKDFPAPSVELSSAEHDVTSSEEG